ncbi:MAG: hypothetical protein AAGB05_01175 [Pseudomonadota bacterium]
MTNGIALVLGGLALALTAANFALGWGWEVIVGQLLLDAITWLAFWR